MARNTILRFNEALTEFYERHPLDFFLFDEEGRQVIYILNEDSIGKTHHLIIANNSDRNLKITPPDSNIVPGPDNYHFEVRFRPGILSELDYGNIQVGSTGWRLKSKKWTSEEVVGTDIDEGTISLFILFYLNDQLVIPGRDTIMLPLHNIKSEILGGTRGSRMELRYQIDPEQDFLIADPNAAVAVLGYRQERIEIQNLLGVKDLPMHAGFIGTHSIITGTQINGDVGFAGNTLTLQVSNLLRNSYIPLCARYLSSPTKFILSFDTSEKQAAWALTNNTMADDILITDEAGNALEDWHVEKETQGQTVQWILTLHEDKRIGGGGYFRFKLNNIKSDMPTGFANLYLQYENIPGYRDGRFVVPIQKTPFVLVDQPGSGGLHQKTKVGIGTANPETDLHIKGIIKAEVVELDGGGTSGGSGAKAAFTTPSIQFKDQVIGQQEGAPSEDIKLSADGGDIELKGTIKTLTTAANKPLSIDAGNGNITTSGSINANSPSGEIKFNGTIKSTGVTSRNSTSFNNLKITANTGDIETEGDVSLQGKLSIKNYAIEKVGNNSNTNAWEKERLEVKQGATPVGGFIPAGGIIMWSGTNIPAGWALCDGSTYNGFKTPDLRGRFIVGYENMPTTLRERPHSDTNYNNPGNLSEKGTSPGNRAGEKKHALSTLEMPRHNHSDNGSTVSIEPIWFSDMGFIGDVIGEDGNWRNIKDGEEVGKNGLQAHKRKRTITDLKGHYKPFDELQTDSNLPLSGSVNIRINNTGGKLQANGSYVTEPHENRPPYYVLAFIMKL